MKSFELRDVDIHLTRADLIAMARAWPSLETLTLGCEDIDSTVGPELDLQDLIPFARHCPHLHQLGLYLNANVVPNRSPSPRSPIRFKSLRTLSVGASSLSSVDSTALFLSQLLPPGCRIESGVRWPDAFGLALDKVGIVDDRRVKMAEWWVGWNDVGKVLPLATEARMEERARIALLEREIERMKLERK